MVSTLPIRPFPGQPDWLFYADVSPEILCLDEGSYRSAEIIIGESATLWPAFLGRLLSRVSAQAAMSQGR